MNEEDRNALIVELCTAAMSFMGSATKLIAGIGGATDPVATKSCVDLNELDDLLPPPKKRKTSDIPRVRNVFDGVIEKYNNREFQSHFRLTRPTFDWLLRQIEMDLMTRKELNGRFQRRENVGRPIIEANKQLLSVLWLLATPDCFRSVAERFGMSKSSLHRCFQRVVSALLSKAQHFCGWPNAEERRRISSVFQEVCGMEGIVGVIDCTYVAIKAPSDDPNSYVNRKCFHGITLQAICDDQCRFIDNFTGYPSSVSDTRIFQNSSFYKRNLANPKLFFSPHEYLLGDKAYETKPYLVPPYKQGRDFWRWQEQFNYQHAKCRSIIERTFALFFGRFRRFTRLDMSRRDWIPATIVAATILHNICLMRGGDDMESTYEEWGNEYLQELRDVRDEDGEPRSAPPNTERYNSNLEGRLFRDELARKMGLLLNQAPINQLPHDMENVDENPDNPTTNEPIFW